MPLESVANWLYGVAYRTAMKANATNAKRKAKERSVRQMPQRDVVEDAMWGELEPILDRELNRLPDKYRAPVVLCDLEGKTRKEAARLLDLPEGTLSTRLSRARLMLARRLTRHGFALSGGLLTSALSRDAASACVPPSLVGSTVQAGTMIVVGKAGTGLTSGKVIALVEEVMKSLLLTNLKTIGAVLLAGGVAAIVAVATLASAGQQTVSTPRPSTARTEQELRRITLSNAYWAGSDEMRRVIVTPAGVDSFLDSVKLLHGNGGDIVFMHGEEWITDGPTMQYRPFIERADPNFILRANGKPEVRAKAVGSIGGGSDGVREVILIIPKEALAKMAVDVPYTFHPANSRPGYQWRVRDGVTITRSAPPASRASIEERLNLLERRLEKLEKASQK
jgi:hypothetical protein